MGRGASFGAGVCFGGGTVIRLTGGVILGHGGGGTGAAVPELPFPREPWPHVWAMIRLYLGPLIGLRAAGFAGRPGGLAEAVPRR